MVDRSRKTHEELILEKRQKGLPALPIHLSEGERAQHEETFKLVGGSSITFGCKDGHVTYPEFGLNPVTEDGDDSSRNVKHDSIMKWLNSNVPFNNHYEQVILSRIMYLTNYGIIYPNKEHYSHMNAVLVHDKETTLKYSRRWSFYDRYINLEICKYTGYSLDDFLSKTPYETDRLFAICEKKINRANSQIAELKDKLEDN